MPKKMKNENEKTNTCLTFLTLLWRIVARNKGNRESCQIAFHRLFNLMWHHMLTSNLRDFFLTSLPVWLSVKRYFAFINLYFLYYSWMWVCLHVFIVNWMWIACCSVFPTELPVYKRFLYIIEINMHVTV